jgi:16S rRNA (uracil1498-N3)-methyltransferase
MPDHSGIVWLDSKETHYLIRVRRLSSGSSIPLLLQGGTRAQGMVEQTSSGQWIIRIQDQSGTRVQELTPIQVSQSDPLSQFLPDYQPRLHLILGYPKGKKLDQSLRQATELGVTTIYPVVTDNAVPDLGPKDWVKKRERLEGIIREAAQQSNCTQLPKLGSLSTLPQVLADFSTQFGKETVQSFLGVFFHEKPLAQKTLSHYLLSKPTDILVAVGPEGGFSPKEVQLFLKEGCIPGYLGSTILRCETAVVAALAALKILSLEA